MKTYYYGPPSRAFVKAAFGVRNRAPRWLRYPTAAVLVIGWALLVPPAWLLVKAGEIGHSIGGWCGFETRTW